jgi:uroporphyrinogen decarboxylase
MATNSTIPNFNGLGVATFESRRAEELAALISKCGGVPHVGPSMREVPMEDNAAAYAFAEKLLAGKIDAVVFMTGVGTRALVETLESRYPTEEIVHGLSNVTTIVRGAKPAKVLRELGVPVTLMVPDPNTWREILQEIDENPRSFAVKGSRIAVQEYGAPNAPFLEELRKRGADVLPVPVYRWALPEDLGPLERTLRDIIEGRARVALFTNGVQVDHALRVAAEKGIQEPLLKALEGCAVGSVGPTCTEALNRHGLDADLEASPPKMGVLVLAAARQAERILEGKRSGGAPGSKQVVSDGLGPAVTSPVMDRRQTHELVRDSRFMKACRREPTDVTPVWLMRQAGRFMKEYRELRAKVPFLKLCKDPDLVAEVTVTAARKLGVDAAIIFADLLLIVEPLGFELEYDKGEGPVVTPVVRGSPDMDRLLKAEPRESLEYVFQAIRKARAALDPATPLIGFAGAPFTLASYIIEGGASKTFRHTKALMYRDPGAWRELMTRLADRLAEYVNGQIEAGVDAVQIFDSWVGCLGAPDYREYVLPYSRQLMAAIQPGIPVIHFGLGTGQFLEEMRRAGGDVIGLDFHVELEDAWRRVGYDVAVQGNLDPTALYADLPFIRRRVDHILAQAAGRPGHIFNLGHGVLPDTPEENVIELVRMVHELSPRRRAV